MYTDKGLTTALEVGKDYNIETEQKQSKNGFKYNIIVKADMVSGTVTQAKTFTKSTANTPAKAVDDKEKMTKEDWAKKDEGIKWLACIKASADFNANRPDITIQKVISDAKELFKSDPNEATTEQESEVL
jgi:hypothetical protein